MARGREATVDLNGLQERMDAALNDLANKENRMRAHDPVELYGQRNGFHAQEVQTLVEPTATPMATVLTEPENLTQERINLREAGRRYTQTLCGVVRGKIDNLKQMIAGLETELGEMEERHNLADNARVETEHKIMTAVSDVSAQLHDLTAAVRASGA